MFEKRTFGVAEKDVATRWKKLRNEELYDLYSTSDQWVSDGKGACSTYGRDDKFVLNFSREPEGKR
jgi:hypothetical protein